jgi:hypothetical protein
MEYSYHEMEKTNIKYLIQWMTETQNCKNIKVDNQESRLPDIRTSYQEFEALAYPVVHSWIKLNQSAIAKNDEFIMFKHLKGTAIGTNRFKYN